MRQPWLVKGNSNIVLNEEEKIGGQSVYPFEFEDFSFFLNSDELFDFNFKGNPFIWWNDRVDDQCIFKKLEKMVGNQEFLNCFGISKVEHLSRTNSNHDPLFYLMGFMYLRY